MLVVQDVLQSVVLARAWWHYFAPMLAMSHVSMTASYFLLLAASIERYYITIAVLAKNGSATLSRGELEKLCILTAQRISQLHEFEAPEFYDQKLFRQFIGELRNQDYLTNTEDGKLEFGDALDEIGRDARFILSKEIRHGIARAAPQALASSIEVGD